MLLRLHVRGFKNLRDVDIRFGPLTCLVGPNGVGKSNVFDAIQFLRHLARDEVHRAAEAIRQPNEGGFGPIDLLWNRDPKGELALTVDMLAPAATEDDFGVPVTPAVTLLRYEVSFRYSEAERRLILTRESLTHLPKGDAKEHLGFDHSAAFRDSVIRGRRFGKSFISTTEEEGVIKIQLHQDGGSRGRPVPAGTSPRTVLGGTTTQEYPTIVAARREMLSWHTLHLEPSSLRTPDRIGQEGPVDEHGRHIAATLHRLGVAAGDVDKVCVEAANRLSQLIPAVRGIRIQEDLARQHRIVEVLFEGSPWLPPRSLSDGTLRYLALVVMQMDASASRVLCIEEPENGIHPFQVPHVVQVLRDYAVDPAHPVDANDNPLRQIILNSHSPELVKQLAPDEVLFMESLTSRDGLEARVRAIDCADNWRGQDAELVGLAEFEHWVGGTPRVPPMQQTLFG